MSGLHSTQMISRLEWVGTRIGVVVWRAPAVPDLTVLQLRDLTVLQVHPTHDLDGDDQRVNHFEAYSSSSVRSITSPRCPVASSCSSSAERSTTTVSRL
jgi:hypothetical protein